MTRCRVWPRSRRDSATEKAKAAPIGLEGERARVTLLLRCRGGVLTGGEEMKRKSAVGAWAVCTLAGAAWGQTDLVANGGFETGAFAPEWTQFGDTGFTGCGDGRGAAQR